VRLKYRVIYCRQTAKGEDMIITFSVQNFRSIRQKITLDFRASSDNHLEEYFVYEIPKPKVRILRMAMIYGANASGKTNILKALEFLREFISSPISVRDEPIKYLPFALDSEKPSTFEIEFCHEDIMYSYNVELNTERILSERLDYYPKGRVANVFQRDYDPKKDAYKYKWTYRGYSKAIQDRLELSIRNQSVLTTIASIEAKGPLQKAREWFKFYLLRLLEPQHDLKNLVVNAISKKELSREFALSLMKTADLMITDYKLIELQVSEEILREYKASTGKPYNSVDEPTPKFVLLLIEHSVDGGNFMIEFLDESSGTQRFFGFAALLNKLIKRPVSVSIDELDSSLHHDLVIHFLYMFLSNSKSGQLLFTTHDISLLGEKDIARRDCIWITERKKDGSTKLSNVWDNYPVRREHSIESLYKKGFLGGKPFLGSIHIEVDDVEEA